MLWRIKALWDLFEWGAERYTLAQLMRRFGRIP
jgi:hypothetical protein